MGLYGVARPVAYSDDGNGDSDMTRKRGGVGVRDLIG